LFDPTHEDGGAVFMNGAPDLFGRLDRDLFGRLHRDLFGRVGSGLIGRLDRGLFGRLNPRDCLGAWR
jgi:hypothetical protein